MAIQPHGRLLPVDAMGFLCRDTAVDKVPEAWWPLINGVIAAYQVHCGEDLHSVYLRGSVPRGLAIEDVSDLDTFAVLRTHISAEEPEWVEPACKSLHRQFAVGTGVEMVVIGMNHVLDPDLHVDRLIATQSLCVHGVDLIDAVPRYRPDRSMVTHIPGLDHSMDQISGWLDDPDEDDAEVCRWIMKRIVRVGLEMHIEEAGVYTRDLWPCYQVFAEHCPDQAEQMYRAMELAVFPISDREQISAFVESFGRWLAKEAQRKYAVTASC